MTAAALETARGASVVAGRHRPTVNVAAPQIVTIDSIHSFTLVSTPGAMIMMNMKKR